MNVPTLYGVRHHGPGSARSLRQALTELEPDVVLIEGPPEADSLVKLASEADMHPPVALLGYVPGKPETAAFWPFAVFSPEWQAISYALGTGVPVRFCDLPAAHQLGHRPGAPRGRGPIRSASWPGRPATTTRSGGGRTSSSTSREPPSSAPWPRPSRCCAPGDPEPDPHDAVREAYMRKVLRRTVRRTATSGSPSSAAPGTSRP